MTIGSMYELARGMTRNIESSFGRVCLSWQRAGARAATRPALTLQGVHGMTTGRITILIVVS
jgi:hypothetical protein